MRAKNYVTLFLICCQTFGYCKGNTDKKEQRIFSTLEGKLELALQEYVLAAAKWLEGINDKHLGDSELGRLMHYKEIKPKLEGSGRTGERGLKKMSMGMMPLVFHVGATSTWMLITSLMAAKSVAIGIALLVFKIAVSSAKVASFFTALKGKHADHHHHDWSWSPHYEHHGYERSLAAIGPPVSHSDWHTYKSEYSSDAYKTIPAEEFEEVPPGLHEHERKTASAKFT